MINIVEIPASAPAGAEPKADGDTLIGDLLLMDGKLTESDVKRVVGVQRHEGIRFGEAAMRLGLVRDEDVDRALALQFDYPYIKDGVSNLDRRLLTAYEPASPATELFRSLRSELMLRWFSDHQKSLAIASARGREGGSSVAANLAIVFAQLGERTLLVDANLRSPIQHKLFGIEQTDGLSALLGGRIAFKHAVRSVAPFERLSLLCAGGMVPNPQELLARDTFANLMESLPAKFDIIIVDTPPVLETADAQITAARAGGCLLVARRHRTKLRDLKRAATRLAPSGAVMLGTVISD